MEIVEGGMIWKRGWYVQRPQGVMHLAGREHKEEAKVAAVESRLQGWTEHALRRCAAAGEPREPGDQQVVFVLIRIGSGGGRGRALGANRTG